MTRNHAPLVAAEDLTRAVSGHLTVRTEVQPARVHDIRAQGGFARDFATVNGQRVMVAALTHQQFADLARTTRLGRTFAFLERLLPADFSTCGDLYTHRATIAALLAVRARPRLPFNRDPPGLAAAVPSASSIGWRLRNHPDRDTAPSPPGNFTIG